eukprot:528512_1
MAQNQTVKKQYDPNEKVVITIKTDQHDPLTIKVKLKTKWEKLISAFCQTYGLDAQYLRFLYDDHRIDSSESVGDMVYDEDYEESDTTADGIKKFVITGFVFIIIVM